MAIRIKESSMPNQNTNRHQWITTTTSIITATLAILAFCGISVWTDVFNLNLFTNQLRGDPQTRAQALEVYDSIYTRQGWCELWDQLKDDNLIDGNCPTAVNQVVSENIISNNGQTIELITGVQTRISSDIEIRYPACVNYGIDSNYATIKGGQVQSWTSTSNLATNTTVVSNSFFTLYFRCDHISWN